LVDAFEDIEHAHGGTLIDDEGTSLISYTTPDGKILEIDLENGRVSLGSSWLRRCSELLESVRQYRFSVSGPTRVALLFRLSKVAPCFYEADILSAYP
jgi:hypothetical protein